MLLQRERDKRKKKTPRRNTRGVVGYGFAATRTNQIVPFSSPFANRPVRLTRERLWGWLPAVRKAVTSRALTTPVNPHRGSPNRLACTRDGVPYGRGRLSTRLVLATGKRGLCGDKTMVPKVIQLVFVGQIAANDWWCIAQTPIGEYEYHAANEGGYNCVRPPGGLSEESEVFAHAPTTIRAAELCQQDFERIVQACLA